MTRLTIRRELLDMPRAELLKMADDACNESRAALAELAALAGTDPIGAFVDAYERHALAARRVAQVHAAIALRGRRRKGRAHHG